MQHHLLRAIGGLALIFDIAFANAADCPHNGRAIGTSRKISISHAEPGRLGTLQYAESLPLGDWEIVLTFDDGPLPP